MPGRPPSPRTGLRLHRDRLALRRLILALRAHPPADGSAAAGAWLRALRHARGLQAALSALARAHQTPSAEQKPAA
jgi:hypothetical protein